MLMEQVTEICTNAGLTGENSDEGTCSFYSQQRASNLISEKAMRMKRSFIFCLEQLENSNTALQESLIHLQGFFG